MFWGTIIYFFLYFFNCESILITSTVPADIQNIKQSFKLYQDNLLNENVLPFLKKCYDPNCCIKNDDLLCPSYFELVRLFNINNVTINATDQQLLKEVEKFSSDFAGNVDEFCRKIPKYIPENSFYKLQHKQNVILKAINDSNTCRLLCTNLELNKGMEYTIKSLCNFILWMSEKLVSLNNQNITERTATNLDQKTVPVNSDLETVSVNIVEHTNAKINLSLNKTQNENTSIVKQIPNSTLSLPKFGQLKTNSASKINSKSNEKNLDEITKIENEKPQVGKVVVEEQKQEQQQQQQEQQQKQQEQQQQQQQEQQQQQQEQQQQQQQEQQQQQPERKEKQQQNKPQEQQKQPQDQQGQQQQQQQQQQDQEVNDLDGSDDVNSFKNKQDLNAYSEDDEDEDDSTTNDIFKTNFNFKDSKIENVKENFDQSIYEKNENTIISTDPFYEESGSNFFIYFLIAMFICMIAYVIYHNKSKILALVIEGRRSQKGKTRRKHLAGYRKLDTNLEEAITSTSSAHATQIIY